METLLPFRISPAIELVAMLWVIFAVSHSIFASATIKERLKYAFPILRKGYRIFYIIGSVLMLSFILVYSIQLPSEAVLVKSSLNELLGLMFCLYGVLIFRIAIKSYGINEFLGLKASDSETPKTINHRGLLKYVRHPMYTASILIFFGLFFYFPTNIALAHLIFALIYIMIGIQFEERRLLNEYGESYREYCRKVPMIIPNIKPN